MKSKTLIWLLAIGTFLLMFVLVVWDSLTPILYESLTTNPLHVDWKSFSLLKNTDINAYIQSILSAVLGFILTLVFVEIIINKSRAQEAKRKRELQLKNIMKVLDAPLERYKTSAFLLLYHNNEGATTVDIKDISMPIDIKSFDGIYIPHLMVGEGALLESKLHFYSRCLTELNRVVFNVILNTDLTENGDIADILSRFYSDVYEYNSCEELLDYSTKKGEDGKRKMSDLAIEMLKNYDGEEIPAGHILYPFLILKKMVEKGVLFEKDLRSALDDSSN